MIAAIARYRVVALVQYLQERAGSFVLGARSFVRPLVRGPSFGPSSSVPGHDADPGRRTK